MLSTDFSTNCAPNFQNTDILITPGNTSAENRIIAYNNIESFFYISFALTMRP